ncbi:MAG: bifunctional UDP-N-acetylglucosamine diphosphorylase/glucosamine-1-phosphate N-acetyltransferase GlmU [Alphaproteobacteria bacterium]|nr:bifunctional UDP-N-acetylglucosamine diphosphorylase/glucosamine-1-phosphate N-acetyltransferase GlmU [Alphaproteobacteria bacterium]
MARSLAVVVLAAGAGTRMKSSVPKVLHKLAGWPMLRHVVEAAARLKPARIVGVVPPSGDAIAAAFAPHPVAVQRQPRGTGDALRAALPALKDHQGPVIAIFGDAPLFTTATLRRLIAACARRGAAVGVLGFRPADPAPYGRLFVEGGRLQRIVEARDCTAEQRRNGFCNSGVMCIDGAKLAALMAGLRNDNAKREYYLTDLVELAVAAGDLAVAVEGDAAEFMGINTRQELAVAEAALQARLRAAALAGGATLADPASVWFAADTRLGRDVTVGPNVRFGPGVRVAANVEIKAFCDLEGCSIASGAIVGPFARIRPGSSVGRDVHIGNFVELKATTMDRGAKANHLAYLGDGRVGAGSNVGAGTIFVNYDGYGKYRTDVGAGAFIGSNSALVAPVKVGRGANVTAGSVVTEDVPAGAVAFGRARQATKKGRAAALRAKLKARAAEAKRARKD